jgi:serine/threonine protein kinase HipA of HipAB toxin-antitoxin module
LKNHAILWTQNKDGWRFRLSPFYDLVPCRLYTKDDDELGLKICGKNRGLSREHFDKWTSESLGLSVQEIDDFMDRVRSERSFILDAMRGYGLSEDRISGMMHLIATGMNQLKRGTR